jgi:tellurite resistance protein
LKDIFGKSWQKVATTINESTQKIYEEGSKKGINFQDKSFSGIRKEERELIWKAIKQRQSFDEIMRTSILFDDEHRKKNCSQSDEERLKHRLLLCTAWEIAIADGKIEGSELQLHNRMADKLGISRDKVKEIRRVLNLKHERELWQVGEELKPNGSKTKILKSVREQYYLQPAADNL